MPLPPPLVMRTSTVPAASTVTSLAAVVPAPVPTQYAPTNVVFTKPTLGEQFVAARLIDPPPVSTAVVLGVAALVTASAVDVAVAFTENATRVPSWLEA